MDAQALRAMQAPIKDRYKADPQAGASLASETREEKGFALAPYQPRNGASLPKEGREKVRLDGGEGGDC